ncbi:MAG: ABC transporter substrate-binding protein, partial [Nitriliruptorales bacterium]|nr:ABC transporter substrate-binding protein [Nitriliruptorales bacterium]
MKMSKKLRVFSALAAMALIAGACGGDDATDEPTGDGTGTTVASGDYDWSDVRLRQAVSMAIDREAITSTIFLGARSPGDDWWPSTFPGYR